MKSLCSVALEAPNNAHEKFLVNVVLILLGQHCNVVWEAPDNIAQERILCINVLILLEQYCAGNILYNVVPGVPNNIAPEKN